MTALAGGRTRGREPQEDVVHLQEQFADLAQQTHAARLGTWVFLASEVLFFGVLITAYAVLRVGEPEAFRRAAGQADLALGTTMTYLLVSASFLVALAVGAIRLDRARAAAGLLGGAAAIGVVFLALKLLEYSAHLSEGLYPGRYYAGPHPDPGTRAFFTLYYLTTGLHFLHVTAGVLVLVVIALRVRRGAYGRTYHTPLELGAMYWHFVDVVWLFLWPMFYLWR